ncbi:MAG: exodeoxyribonuclease VII large subunit [Clostridiales bacterium]|nr:exodeoxyribonuclease VII large subunit [Clostridiales bacterium]
MNPMSVTELNKYIKNKFAGDEFLQNVLIKGELSNFKNHYTGHMYFTLKDETSLIKGIMFKTYTSNLKFVPKDGMSVVIFGTVSVFERDGQYQIYCKDMMLDGMGALYASYEELKNKLEKEGLFDVSHKKKIPMFSDSIGVITSQTGAVIRDIINVSTRRNPNVNIKLIPSAVQGEGAGEKIAKAIRKFNELNNVDVIIIARGGGSLEDLWPFNEEVVARAIYESNLPVISAVGHETDFSISDFVADLRAPTPSAAAELAVIDVNEAKWKLQNYKNSLRVLLNRKLENMKNRYERCKNSVIFTNPYLGIQNRYQLIDRYIKKLTYVTSQKYNMEKNKYTKLVSILDSISPLKTLERGYSIVQNEQSKVIKSISDVNKGDKIKVVLKDGNIDAEII